MSQRRSRQRSVSQISYRPKYKDEEEFVKYSTAISHIVLAGISIYCASSIESSNTALLKSALGFISLYAVLGIFKWAFASCDPIYNLSCVTMESFSETLVLCYLFLQHGYLSLLVYCHIMAAMIPVLLYITDSPFRGYVSLLVLLSSIEMIYVSVASKSNTGFIVGLIYAINYFCNKGYVEGKDEFYADCVRASKLDYFNYGLCVYTLLIGRFVSEESRFMHVLYILYSLYKLYF